MKRHPLRDAMWCMLAAMLLAAASGCTVTPNIHAGISLERENGSWKLNPHASVGITGRP